MPPLTAAGAPISLPSTKTPLEYVDAAPPEATSSCCRVQTPPVDLRAPRTKHAAEQRRQSTSELFRRGNILDLCNGGYAAHGFRAKLLDVEGMGHDVCDARTLKGALAFLESQ